MSPASPSNLANAWPRRRLLAGLGSIACAGLPGCAWIDARQRAAVYRPERRVPESFRGLAATDESFQLVSGRGSDRGPIVLWWMPHADGNAPAIIYLHGTFRNLYYNHPKMIAIREAGFSVLGVEYRGWGDSAAILPSEQTIYEDTELAWGELRRRVSRPQRRAIFGHSMGGGAATYLASKVTSGASSEAGLLVVESTFTRLTAVARAVSAWGYPLAWFATQEFDSAARAAAVKVPVLMMHGALDRTVPIGLGRELFSAFQTEKEFVEFAEGSHSRLHAEDPVLYQASLRRWAMRLRAAA